MNKLIKWVEFGRVAGTIINHRTHRQWMNEERGRIPVIDRVNYPETGINRRITWRG